MKLGVLALVLVSVGGFGCGSIVSGGGGGDCTSDNNCAEGGAGQGGGSIGQGGVGGAVSDSGVAVPWEDLANVAPAPAGTLLLAFGSGPEACADPLGDIASCTPELTWRAEIPLPAELQYVGASVDLAELQGVGYGPFFSESQSEGGNVCSGGGGTLDGHLEVLAIDGQNITIRLTDTLIPEAPIDGERTLLRCGGDDPPPTASALALTEAQLGALYGGGGTGGSAGTGGDPPPPSGYLYLFLDQSQQPAGMTCSDPYALNQGCAFDREVMIVSLAPTAQAVGSYAIGAGQVDVTVSESGPNGDGTCWGGGGAGFTEGTVEVLAIDASGVQVRVTSPLGNPEGTAARCP